MHATIRRYSMDPNNVSEVLRRIRQSFLPLISKMPGFVAYYDVDQGAGVLATVSIFQSRMQAEQSNRVAEEWRIKNVPSLQEAPAEITVGQVVNQELAVQVGESL